MRIDALIWCCRVSNGFNLSGSWPARALMLIEIEVYRETRRVCVRGSLFLARMHVGVPLRCFFERKKKHQPIESARCSVVLFSRCPRCNCDDYNMRWLCTTSSVLWTVCVCMYVMRVARLVNCVQDCRYSSGVALNVYYKRKTPCRLCTIT